MFIKIISYHCHSSMPLALSVRLSFRSGRVRVPYEKYIVGILERHKLKV